MIIKYFYHYTVATTSFLAFYCDINVAFHCIRNCKVTKWFYMNIRNFLNSFYNIYICINYILSITTVYINIIQCTLLITDLVSRFCPPKTLSIIIAHIFNIDTSSNASVRELPFIRCSHLLVIAAYQNCTLQHRCTINANVYHTYVHSLTWLHLTTFTTADKTQYHQSWSVNCQ